jgi:ABC-2 type transport system ATP-binding protein
MIDPGSMTRLVDQHDSRIVIEARQLTRYYGRRVGVRSLDLLIAAGQIFGFLGPNGAGKTTTIRLLLGFLRASAGRATIFGHDCWSRRALINRDVGYLPGDLRLYPWLTGNRALQISQRIRGMDLSAAGRELSAQFRLEMNLRVREMSRGMRQKLGLILALAHRPRLLVLDEPTSGLDPLMQDILMDLLRQRAAQGATVFFSSHTLSEVEQLCDRIAIVRDGEVVVDDSLDVLRRKARREVTLLFSTEETAQQVPVPEFLALDSRYGRRWHGELTGAPSVLIQWAAAQLLDDLEIGPPSLENLFRAYYREPEEAV